MERTKQGGAAAVVDPRPEIWWRNYGGNHRTADGRSIRSGEKFKASPDDIPLSLRDVIKNEEPIPVEQEEELALRKTEYQTKVSSPGWFDVLNIDTQKKMNENPLHLEDAEALVESLTG